MQAPKALRDPKPPSRSPKPPMAAALPNPWGRIPAVPSEARLSMMFAKNSPSVEWPDPPLPPFKGPGANLYDRQVALARIRKSVQQHLARDSTVPPLRDMLLAQDRELRATGVSFEGIMEYGLGV